VTIFLSVPKGAAVVYIPARHPSTPPNDAALPEATRLPRATVDALLDDATHSIKIQRYNSAML